MLNTLKAYTLNLGLPKWEALLTHVASLHQERVHSPFRDLPYMWEDIGSTDTGQPLYGHWDTIHQALDVLHAEPGFAWNQIANLLTLQQPDGRLPGPIMVQDCKARYNTVATYPPLWPVLVEAYLKGHEDEKAQEISFQAASKQIDWFRSQRRCREGGYTYIDLLDRHWESGIIRGLRADLCECLEEPQPCVDASSQVYLLLDYAIRWGERYGRDVSSWKEEFTALRELIQTELYHEKSGFFYDKWAIDNELGRYRGVEGFWPLIVGAASPCQAARVIDENVCCPHRFFTEHPIPTVAVDEPRFELAAWRGPVRNSMVYWVAKGCMRYQRPDVAKKILEKALSCTASLFNETGSIWGAYHPEGMSPEVFAQRPREDLLGHNPLIAMATLWQQCRR